MITNKLPKANLNKNETGCCPRFEPEPWDEQELTFKDKLFAKTTTINFLHTPLNMGSRITSTWKKIHDAGADWKEEFAILSYDSSPWRGEHFFPVAKEVPGLAHVKMSGKFLTKVFEGPYKDAKKWYKELGDYARSKGKEPVEIYFYYTTCPKCGKYYGKNYVVGFVKVR